MTENNEPGGTETPGRLGRPVPPRLGKVRQQSRETAQPRPPRLDEQLATQRVEAEAHERELAERAEAARKARIRRRVMIGSAATVGVVAVVAIGYAIGQPEQVTARCVDQNGTVAQDNQCDEAYVNSHGGHYGGGFFYIGGSSYRYYYGGSGAVGQHISGGSTVRPGGNANISTPGGKTISRGGFGIHGGGGS